MWSVVHPKLPIRSRLINGIDTQMRVTIYNSKTKYDVTAFSLGLNRNWLYTWPQHVESYMSTKNGVILNEVFTKILGTTPAVGTRLERIFKRTKQKRFIVHRTGTLTIKCIIRLPGTVALKNFVFYIPSLIFIYYFFFFRENFSFGKSLTKFDNWKFFCLNVRVETETKRWSVKRGLNDEVSHRTSTL